MAEVQKQLANQFDFEAASSPRVRLRTLVSRTIVNLRGRARDESFRSAVQEVIGADLPDAPNRWTGEDGTMIVWLGPDEWLCISDMHEAADLEARLRAANPRDPWFSVVDVSHNYTGFRLAGECARTVLAKGCPLDLHPRSFGSGNCGQTLLAQTRVLLRHTHIDNEIEIWVRNSFSRYTAHWLTDAMAEFAA